MAFFTFSSDTVRPEEIEPPSEPYAPIPVRKVETPFISLGKYSAKSLKDSVTLVAEQIGVLQNILEASTVDPKMYFHTHVKAWIINNPTLRDSLFFALMASDSSIQSEAGSDAEILATEGNDLIEARFGTAVFKGVALKQALEKSGDKYLYQKILESNRYSRDIELRDTTFVIPTMFDASLLTNEELLDRFSYIKVRSSPDSEMARVDFSAYGLSFRVGPVWGGEIRMGNDELGLPFWTSGKTSFLAMYKQVKVGFELPTPMGKNSSDKFLFPVRNRLLSGTRGVTGEFDFGYLGGYISATRFTSNDLSTVTDPSKFYYITAELLGYSSFGFSITPTSWARLKVGVGFHQVREGSLTPAGVDSTGAPTGGQLLEMNSTDFSSPYIRFEYLHQDHDEAYGGGIQYYNASILSSAWLQIVPRILRVELKFSKPILRTLRDWENPDFIIISPRLFLSF